MSTHKKLNIAIIGSRGIPCAYGGFETFAEHLATALVERGHKVTVYGQFDKTRNVRHEDYHGVECLNLRAPEHKALQKPVLALKATAHSLKGNPDIVFFLGVSAAPFSFLSRLKGAKTIINLDGLEWKRGKWGRTGRAYLRASEWLSTKTSNAVVADSRALAEIYSSLYGIESVYIPYGADVAESVPADSLGGIGLEPGKYILQSCRLEPENNVDLVIEGYLKSGAALPLVIVGDAPMGRKYKERLLELADGKVRFLGPVYGPAYWQIVAHAGLYVHAHEVGGTNPSLLEAMALGKAPLYLDVPFNREVAGDAGWPFRKDAVALAALMNELVPRMDEVLSRADTARRIIRERYSWPPVVDAYEKLFYGILDETV